jgi:uncharacterized MAPEG superfamily protein
MKTELMCLVRVTVLTAVLWIPYIQNRIMVRGIVDAIGYPANPKPQAPWAQRLQASHGNAVENLVVFAALVFAAHATGVSNNATIIACMIYFWARVVHLLAYTAAFPWVPTLAFAGGFFCQMTIAVQLLGR